MSTRKKTYTRSQMVEALMDMDRQIIDGSDIFKQAADMIEYTASSRPKMIIRGYEDQENEMVAILLHGIPKEGGFAPKNIFEELIRAAFQGGLCAVTQSPSRNRSNLPAKAVDK